jgi:hypothetical protein
MPCSAARRARRTWLGSATATTVERSGWRLTQRAYPAPRWPAPTTIRETGAIGVILPYGPVAKFIAIVF